MTDVHSELPTLRIAPHMAILGWGFVRFTTLEGTLGLAGGTLLWILSGVEIVFYLAKFIGKRFTKRNTRPSKMM